MIVFDLSCRPHAHRFEGWFGSSADFADQQARGLLLCPTCGSAEIVKSITAPNLGRKSNQHTPSAAQSPTPPAPVPQANAPLPPAALAALKTIAMRQAEALKSSTWVGDRFAETARAIHYGEQTATAIHGQATTAEAEALCEEGVEITPILFPITPPGTAN